VITQVNVKNFASYKWGVEAGMVAIIEQLLKTLPPEQVAKLSNLPLDKIIEIKQNVKFVNEQDK
jgi:hypothetical protein